MENKNNHLQKNSSKELQISSSDTVKLFNNTLKIRDFAENNRTFWGKTRMTLAKCSLIIGSKTAPTDEEYLVLKETLIKNFKDFSPEDIADAFDKLVAGKLNVESDKYGKISAAYLGQVLIGYREYRNKLVAKSLKEQAKVEVKKEVTQEEKDKIRAEFLENCLVKPYNEIKEKGFFDMDKAVCLTLFKLFRRAELVNVNEKDDVIYHDKAVQDLKEDAKMDFKAHKPIQKFFEGIRAMNAGKDANMQRKVTARACSLYFKDYIMQMNKNNRDINEIIKKL
jgi:hypothetical protein